MEVWQLLLQKRGTTLDIQQCRAPLKSTVAMANASLNQRRGGNSQRNESPVYWPYHS